MIQLIILYIIIMAMYCISYPSIEGFPGEDSIKRWVRGLVSSVTGGIISQINRLKSIPAKIKSLPKKFSAIGKIFRSLRDLLKTIYKIMKSGFKLMKDIAVMMKNIAELLELIMNKLKMCATGFKEVYSGSRSQLGGIRTRLNKIQRNLTQCSKIANIDFTELGSIHIKFKSSMKACVQLLTSVKDEFLDFIRDFKGILKNSKLFAQKYGGTDGQSIEWCKRHKRTYSKTLSYEKHNKKCNQCFNIHGLIAKGFSEVDEVKKLVTKAKAIVELLKNLMYHKQRLENSIKEFI